LLSNPEINILKTVLITGVTGFIGRYIAREFAQAGWSVVGLGTRPPENAPTQYLLGYYQLTLPSPDLAILIEQLQPQVCIHCAARASVPLSVSEPKADFTDGVVVTFNLLDALRLHAPQCRVIYLSSAAVYGNPKTLPVNESHSLNPISPYGYHKLICEQLCREFFQVYGLLTATVRIFSAYGPGLRRQVIWDICHKALTNPVLNLQGTGNESRDFIHSRDIAKALYLLTEKAPCHADVYNLASGTETSIKELVNLILEQLKLDIPVHFEGTIPIGNPLNWKADINCLKKLGFLPEVTLDRGISVYTQWCRAELMG
jgi:UDP-glucose 4-epimerase